jgi:MraZ protein
MRAEGGRFGMFRGSTPARIDDKGRLKVPTAFRQLLEERYGGVVYVTSAPHHEYRAGDYVRIYPMAEWEALEAKLAKMPSTHPTRELFLTWTSYYGQVAEMDAQGRIHIHQHLREQAGAIADVHVFGQVQFLDIWNQARITDRLTNKAWTREQSEDLAQFGI